MPETGDVTGSQESVSASSALQTAFDNNSEPAASAPSSSAETLNPVTEGNGQQDDASLPFGKHPRWKQVLSERDEFKQKFSTLQSEFEQAKSLAEVGKIWQSALSESPEFAQEVAGLIQKFTGAKKAAQEESLPKDPVVRELLNKVSMLESSLNQGSQYLQKQQFKEFTTQAKSDFKSLIADIQVPKEFEKDFERNVWENLAQLSPESLNNLEYDPVAFKQAVEQEKQRLSGIRNTFVSSYTGEKMRQAVPRTQTGGISTLSAPALSEEEEIGSFVSQLRGLKGV